MKPKIKLMRYFGDIVFICEGLGCFGIGKSPSEAYKKWDEFHESLIYFDVVFQPHDFQIMQNSSCNASNPTAGVGLNAAGLHLTCNQVMWRQGAGG